MGYNLKRATVVMQNVFRAAQGDDGLAPRVFAALALVVQFPHVTQSELARKLGIKRSGLVAIVDELEDLSYLARTTVPGDRRVQALVPTEAGITAFQDALAKVPRAGGRDAGGFFRKRGADPAAFAAQDPGARGGRITPKLPSCDALAVGRANILC